MRWVDLNLKCMLGFHDYKLVDGLYWEYKYINYYHPELMGVNTLKLFECRRCGKIEPKVVELYTKPGQFCIGFDINKVVDMLESEGIKHINEFYVK